MAPWVHTYLSPVTERRMCCASREPAQNFKQYIDTSTGTGKYIPITLDEHWNSEHMKSVRRRMIAGDTLQECEVCNDKLSNVDVYRTYFNTLFANKYERAIKETDADGFTTMQPISWDYRFSNLCNFKCRMCGDVLSSAWESEERQNNMINWDDPKNNWMRPEIKKQIETFQTDQVESEFAKAVEEHRVEEVYWVGGEPLMYEQHWRYMQRIIELGDGPKVYARYNTNLSRVTSRGVDLFRDILPRVRDWQICASLDGTERIGEYIRSGLVYSDWLANCSRGIEIQRSGRQMRIDFTLTLPGLAGIEDVFRLGQTLGIEILAKVVFSFSPDIVWSPLILPRELLHPWLDELIPKVDGAMRDVLIQLKTRPTFAEQWPNTWQDGLVKGKARVLQLEKIRGDKFTMADILSARPDILHWWNNI